MKKTSLLIIITLFFVFNWNNDLFGQKSIVFDDLKMKSEILSKDKKFSIYLPPGYKKSNQTYPVVYLLHGGGNGPVIDKHKDWIQKGDMQKIVDLGIRKGTISPMIIVMPDAEMTYYMNNVNGDYQFEDYFIDELIPYIEENFRCRKEKKFRSIAGLSMGGFGALLYSLHHPSVFSSCASISAGIRTDEEINNLPYDQFMRRYKTALGNFKDGEKRITDFWNSNSILYLVNNLKDDQKGEVRFYIDIGDDDHLYKGNSTLHTIMRDRKIVHEYRVRDGGHTWKYFSSGLEDALEFISLDFK